MLSDEEREALEILKAVGIRCKGINIDEVIINLIEKQSKEIELLKEENEKYKNPPFFDEENYISKEEAEQKEKKAYIDGTNVAHELCNKMWKNKIKAKIEEQEKIINTGGIDFNTKSYARCKKEFGQSLLEKE